MPEWLNGLVLKTSIRLKRWIRGSNPLASAKLKINNLMDNNVLQLILKKLEEIDERVKKIESGTIQIEKKEEEEEKDPLFFKALKIVEKREETPASFLSKELGIDQKRAEKILDQLAYAGYGETYWGEA
jgi:predicted HTH transcriptional regulator